MIICNASIYEIIIKFTEIAFDIANMYTLRLHNGDRITKIIYLIF